MKKLIAAIVIASVGAAFADPALVYDYKASIKRLDISARQGKILGKTQVAQKYSVKSDTVYGYVTLPKCVKCEGDLATSLNIANNGYAYLTMKGNYKNVKDAQYYVLKTPVKASIGVFGAEQTMDGTIVDEGKITKSWMSLDFPMPVESYTDYGTVVAKKDVTAYVPLNFFGLTNQSYNRTRVDVQNTGFGTAKIDKTPGFDFCLGDQTTSCLTLQTISGTLVGYPYYQGACEHQPLWDLCKLTPKNTKQEINDAVICGSWSFKYNKSLTADFVQDGETAILNKFKKGLNTFVLIKADGTFESSNYTKPTKVSK